MRYEVRGRMYEVWGRMYDVGCMMYFFYDDTIPYFV